MIPLLDGETGKICNVCHQLKPLSEYSPNKVCSLGVVGTCKECANQRVSKWYKDNRTRRKQTANDKNRDRKQKMVDHFGDKCHDCGNTYPSCVYHFHHVDPTKKDMN